MSISTAVLAIIAAVMLIIAWSQGRDNLREGLTLTWRTVRRTIPLLLLAFAIVGFVNVLNPGRLVRTWIGPGSGPSGILVGTIAGSLLPGGPYVVFPLIAALYQAGAGLGPTLAMVTSWAALGLISVSFEIPFLGWRFSLMRLGLGVIMPVIVGLVGMLLSSWPWP